ncbi:MAG TPA: endolytic transglycosylase MltG [Clostridiales bacterium]|nr:endolytic transglycosylase MltG [Clostridiales bacterium]
MSQPVIKKEKKSVARRGEDISSQHPILRKLLIYVISFCIVVGTVTFAVKYTYKKFTSPMDPNDNSDVIIVIPMGTSARGIGNILYDEGLIQNKGVFKIFMELSGKSSNVQAGKYKLKKSMSLPEIVEAITSGEGAIPQKKITIPEGKTVAEIANALAESGKFSFTEEEFIKEAANIKKYEKQFTFLQEIPEERRDIDKYPYPLEGYLFPETYFVDEGSTPEDIIKTMLSQFAKVYNAEYQSRADELNLTTDQVVTLASIVQREARLKEEFPKIAAVFHNRINRDMPLESCATIRYITGKNILYVTNEEAQIESKYNTYKYKGLPIGPIACPGELAIKSVLYPDEEMMDPEKPYLYFVLMDPNEGRHSFNYDYDSHIKDKKKYEKLWKNSSN